MPDRKCKMWHKNQRFKIENRRETYLQMQYQKSNIKMFYLASHISILILYRAYSESRILHLASCIFYLCISRDNWGQVSRASRMLYLTPCILLTSHLTFFYSILLHLLFFISYFLCHIMWHTSMSMTYVYDMCMTYVIDIFRHIWHMTHMTHMTHVLYFIWHICHRHFHRHMSYVYV